MKSGDNHDRETLILSEVESDLKNAKPALQQNQNGTQMPECLRMTFGYEPRHTSPSLYLGDHALQNPGEIFVPMAPPGAGKTANVGAIIAAYLASKNKLENVDSLGYTYHHRGKRCFVADTERTADDVYSTYLDIHKRTGATCLSNDKQEIEGVDYMVMGDIGETSGMWQILDASLNTGLYELVILDGGLDFCEGMNDDKAAMAAVRRLRATAVKHDVTLIVSLHPNKGTDTPAGHFGSFLYRWARAFLLIRSVKGNRGIKEITTDFEYAKLSHSDVTTFEPVFFSWNEDRRMLLSCDYTPPKRAGNESDQDEVFTQILSAGGKRYTELVNEVMKAGSCSERTAKRWIEKAENRQLIFNQTGTYVLTPF